MAPRSTYPEEIIHAEREIPACSVSVHHEKVVHVQTKSIREEEDNVSIGSLWGGFGNVGVDAVDFLDGSCWLSIVEIAFETAQIGWFCEYFIHSFVLLFSAVIPVVLIQWKEVRGAVLGGLICSRHNLPYGGETRLVLPGTIRYFSRYYAESR